MRLAGNLHAEMLLGLFLRGAGAVSSFALLWLIARIFGADVVGLYQLGLTTVTLLGTATALGLPELIIRQLSHLINRNDLGDARATFLACTRFVLVRGIICSLVMAAMAVPFSRYILGEPAAGAFLIYFAPAALFLGFIRLTNALLRTTGRVVASQSLEGVFYTTIAAVSLAACWALGMTDKQLMPVWCYQLGTGLAALVSWILARNVIADWPQGKPLIKSNDGAAIAAAPLAGYGGDWLLLLVITGSLGLQEAGIYRTAFQYCLVFQLVNASFSIMAGPHMARSAGKGELPEVGRIVRSAGLIGLGLCLPLAIAGWIAPATLLGLFGPEFRQGALGLQILLLAQIFNVAIGPVGTALVMLHRERYVLIMEIVATVAGVLVALMLVEPFRIAGAAAGPLVSSLIRNIANYVKLRSVLKEHPAAITEIAPEEVIIEPDRLD